MGMDNLFQGSDRTYSHHLHWSGFKGGGRAEGRSRAGAWLVTVSWVEVVVAVAELPAVDPDTDSTTGSAASATTTVGETRRRPGEEHWSWSTLQ